jgi:ribosomal protein S27AE
MHTQTACRISADAESGRPDCPGGLKFAGKPKCPRCGSMVLVAEHSAFNFDGRIRHTWSCDDCGNEFVTSIRALPRRV